MIKKKKKKKKKKRKIMFVLFADNRKEVIDIKLVGSAEKKKDYYLRRNQNNYKSLYPNFEVDAKVQGQRFHWDFLTVSPKRS